MPPSAILNDHNLVYETKAKLSLTGVAHQSAVTINRPAKSAVLHRSLHEDPLRVIGSSGNYLYLSNGQAILDASCGAAVSCLGHNNERVKKAILRQMETVSYCHSLFYSTGTAEELADELIGSTHGHMAKTFIVSSGTWLFCFLCLLTCFVFAPPFFFFLSF